MDTTETILACEEALYAAQRNSDVAALDDLIADDLLFTGPDGRLYSKADDLAAHRQGVYAFKRYEPEEPVIRLINPATAVAAVRIYLEVEIGGAAQAGTFCYTRVWALEEGRWRIAAGHVSAAG